MEYLSFGKSERIAILMVILAILLIVLVPSWINRLRKPVSLNDPLFERQIAGFLMHDSTSGEKEGSGFDFSNPDREVFRRSITPFPFDPNTLDIKGWMTMGFTAKQAKGIIRFREKGGRFRTKEDVKKLYAVTEEVFTVIEPYIRIPANNPVTAGNTATENGRKGMPSAMKERYQAELNSADSAELVKVYGIGPATARKIIRYREKLGGYASIEQLLDIPGIDSARFAMIRDGVFADAEVVNKVEINKASISQLRQHPYIDYYTAKAIVDFRIRKGDFNSPDELRDVPGMQMSLFLKLKPYISVSR